ncbi:hypothetical protein [Xenorhabdus cabanillasii]|uniref:hypothetical protein n=1 Tax=Xenorhabdus cabanillasii TaxID=351673 RepID=UPI0012EC4B1E|nr:hypothetical protein [Xenorhabdus cabanillasii]
MSHYLLIVNDQQPHYAIDVSTSCSSLIDVNSTRCYLKRSGRRVISHRSHIAKQ